MKPIAIILLPPALLTGILYAQTPDAWWRTPDSSVRMAAQSPAVAGEKTRSAAQAQDEKPPFHSIPAPSGITAEQVVFFCVLITAVAAAIFRFIVKPANDARDLDASKKELAATEALNKRFADLRAGIDRDFVRNPEHVSGRALSQRENDLLEDKAQLEHQILAERITGLAKTIQDQGKRLDAEFGKVWKFGKRMLAKMGRIYKKLGMEMTGVDLDVDEEGNDEEE